MGGRKFPTIITLVSSLMFLILSQRDGAAADGIMMSWWYGSCQGFVAYQVEERRPG